MSRGSAVNSETSSGSADRSQERASAVIRGLERLHLDFLAYQPSNIIAPIILHFLKEEEQAGPSPRVLLVAREEEAVGIIGGAVLAGCSGGIVMQDNGFGNSFTALTTFAVAYHIPILIVANTRGGLGEYNSMIHSVSGGVPDMLRAGNVPTFRLDRTHSIDDWEGTVHEAGRHARMTYRPVVLLLDFWEPDA
jgi:sulfopyruvate decarboxylase subunit alpha